MVSSWPKQGAQSAHWHLSLVCWCRKGRLKRHYPKSGSALRCRHLFVHDLVTSEQARGTGCGTKLMQWLEQQARANGCSRHADLFGLSAVELAHTPTNT